jgi:geranylgeranyl diphosphate synthase, type I
VHGRFNDREGARMRVFSWQCALLDREQTKRFMKNERMRHGMVIPELGPIREEIYARMNRYFDELAERIDLPWWTDELTVEFRRFSTTGKAVRGALLVLAYDLFGDGTARWAAIDAGAALEIVHSATLIHDDIMDRDDVRRGMMASHVRLAQGRDEHTGEALAINVGSCGFFMSYDLLSHLDLDANTYQDLLSYYSLTLTKLGLAQMQDVALASSQQLPSAADIERVLIEKSGRYTFSLPLVMGAMIAGAHDRIVFLEEFGERIGFVFQVKDDELALFGDPQVTGKPVGGDVREGKKTLYWRALVDSVSDDDRALLNVFGNRSASDEDIGAVLELFERSGARAAVSERIVETALSLKALLDEQDLTDEQRSAFHALIAWNLAREK